MKKEDFILPFCFPFRILRTCRSLFLISFSGEGRDAYLGACQSAQGGLAKRETVMELIRVLCHLAPSDVLHSVIVFTGIQDSLYFGKPGRVGLGKTAGQVFNELDQMWNDLSLQLGGGVIFAGGVPPGRDR